MEDLRSGLLPLEASELSAEEAWEICYQHMAEFNRVVFSQFEVRLRDHRAQVTEDTNRADAELEGLQKD